MATTGASASAAKASAPVAGKQRVDGRAKAPMTEYLSIVVAIIALGGIYFAHRLSKQREAAARFASAAKDFRAAFADELTALRSGRDLYEDPTFFLRRAYEAKHNAAYIAFEGVVHAEHLPALRAAWRKYHSGHKSYGPETGLSPGGGAPEPDSPFSEYSWHFIGRDADPLHLVAKRIEALLEFAHDRQLKK